MAPPLPVQLDALRRLLGEMAGAATAAMRDSTAALVHTRPRLAERVIAGDAALDVLRARVEDTAAEVLLFHAPVAGDLCSVVAAIRAAGDLERMGDLALHIAKAVRRRAPRSAVPPEVVRGFAEMGELAVALASKAGEVVRSRNVLLAVELDADDDAMDLLHRGMFGLLLGRAWPHGIAAAVDVTLLARYYERFADHAVQVGHETVYAVTGRTPQELLEAGLGR
jgi:phosphate transport system protein